MTLDELLTELGKHFGKITRWRVLCKEQNAITEDEKISLAEQALAEWSTGTIAEFSCHLARLQGKKSGHINDILKNDTQ